MNYTTSQQIQRMCEIIKDSSIQNGELNKIVFNLTIDPMTLISPLSRDIRLSIQRMCEIILGNLFGNSELDSLALSVGHDPQILNVPLRMCPSSTIDSIPINFLYKL